MSVTLPLVLIMGPTASGKTALAIQLVESLPAEIVSVDSAMVYRGMDIGTAKPDAEELRRAPHRLIDILDPVEPYSAARFREDALREIAEIRARGRIPLLVGGTMLYFRALTGGLAELPGADPRVRARLESEAHTFGWEALHRRLAAIDPHTAARLHPNDAQRIQRALEVHELTGRPMTALLAERGSAPLSEPMIRVAVCPSARSVLHERIATRFDAMLRGGFVDEVRALRERGDLDLDTPSMRAVGYRQVWQHLDGRYGREALRERGVAATRQFAKRQLTWLRREPDLHWLEGGSDGGAREVRERIDRMLQ